MNENINKFSAVVEDKERMKFPLDGKINAETVANLFAMKCQLNEAQRKAAEDLLNIAYYAGMRKGLELLKEHPDNFDILFTFTKDIVDGKV